jgi:hypothetical protein
MSDNRALCPFCGKLPYANSNVGRGKTVKYHKDGSRTVQCESCDKDLIQADPNNSPWDGEGAPKNERDWAIYRAERTLTSLIPNRQPWRDAVAALKELDPQNSMVYFR